MMYSFNLDASALELILKGLGQLPAHESAHLFVTLQSLAAQQEKLAREQILEKAKDEAVREHLEKLTPATESICDKSSSTPKK